MYLYEYFKNDNNCVDKYLKIIYIENVELNKINFTNEISFLLYFKKHISC